MAVETTVGKVEDKEVEKVAVILTGAYFFQCWALSGRQQQKVQMSDRKADLSVYH